MFKAAKLAFIAVVASATIASAGGINDLSPFERNQDSRTRVELGTISVSSGGVVEIYSFHQGQLGGLLGSRRLSAGANSRVEFSTRRVVTGAIAVLKVGGQIVDTQRLYY